MNNSNKRTFRKAVCVIALFCMTTQSTFAALINLAQKPLFTGAPIPPKVMLAISKDQQLYKKAYNDYSDLDGDGQIETTYKHSIDYYGYFDPSKCYDYSATRSRFEPVAMADSDKLCTGRWSGNFLNWASMSRMDAVRKLLYGGMRSTDETYATGGVNAVTVLERAYLPIDAHAWAKYYNPPTPTTTDQPAISRLTPFDPPTVPATASKSTSSSFTIPTSGNDYDVPFTTVPAGVQIGDQVKVARTASQTNFFLGTVLSFANSGKTMRVRVHAAGITGTGSDTNWTLTNLSATGISLCNLTTGSSSGSDSVSHTNTRPPLIRVAQGNFALWNANERWQCQWSEERNNIQSGFPNGLRSNGNQLALSEIAGSAENPVQSVHALGSGTPKGEYIARVQVCKPDLVGSERCKLYHDGNLKPIGLLQEYGDREQLHFGLITGSYAKNISGGVLRKNAGPIDDEVRTDTDGTFVQPYMPPNAPRSTSSTATPAGIINTLNYMRIYGWDYSSGSYLGAAGDNCTYQLTNITENSCTSWGNPMSEVFFEAVRYFAGKTASSAYTYSSSSKDNQLGLPVATWTDPLSSSVYCSPLNIVVMNASVSTNDSDLGSQSATSIQGPAQISTLTNAVGDAEGITNNSFFIGKLSSAVTGSSGYELCTAKTINGLGLVEGICPEGPTLAGSFHIAGLAHHAHTQRIRTDLSVPAADTKSLKVTTYGIQLATNVPTLKIPVPGNSAKKVIIQPIYRLDLGSSGLGGGGLVDMKFVRQTTTATTSSGKVYVNWEDSEQGGDYDQDMWGTIEWVVDATANTITITTSAVSASTSNPQGFGYAISGTTKDGPHFHSGIYGFNFTDPYAGVKGCVNCDLPGASSGQRGPQSQTYSLGTTTAGTLQDPLWYAAKFGSFSDSNGNGLPDVQAEWDTRLADGNPGQDGVPDTYFLVTNPLGLEASLDRAFQAIILSASLTAVAANSAALQTLRYVYQARFNTSDWSGGLIAYSVGTNAVIDPTPVFDAGLVLNSTPYGNRTIITYNETAAVRDGVPFRWPANPASPTASEISPALVALLNKSPDTPYSTDGRGNDRLKYLRGDTSRETGASAIFRQRPSTRLGDIVNSNPIYVGPPDGAITDPTYGTFRDTYYSRTPILYVGANDGMLHGFDAATGTEKIAYVPSKTFPNLTKLTSLNYTHRYYVDGTPEIADVQLGSQWRTVLVGGLAGGGQGIYALDVTDPTAFSEANAGNIALWEFNDSDDPDLGYVYGKPAVRKMANGKWAAIVSGGYNNTEADGAASTTGRAYLFIIFLDGPTGPNRTWVAGTDYIKIDTGAGTTTTPNGLAPPFPADVSLDGKIDFIYAGDLLGNMWKFDVSSTAPSTWQSSQSRLSLFTAVDSSGRVQPITSQAEGTLHPTGNGFIIAFGTGKYLETADVTGPFITNSYYGIWDKNDNPGNISNQTRLTGRNQLLVQTITNVTAGSQTWRAVSANAATWSQDTTPPTAGDSPSRHMGWLMDFPSSDSTGERSVSRPILRNSRLIFTSITPAVSACSAGGSSFLMVVEPTTGSRVEGAVLDTNGDGRLNTTDKISSGGTLVFASGVQSTVGISSTPTIVTGGGSGGDSTPGSVILGTTGAMSSSSILTSYAILNSYTVPSPNAIGLNNRSGRVSWREVIRQ